MDFRVGKYGLSQIYGSVYLRIGSTHMSVLQVPVGLGSRNTMVPYINFSSLKFHIKVVFFVIKVLFHLSVIYTTVILVL